MSVRCWQRNPPALHLRVPRMMGDENIDARSAEVRDEGTRACHRLVRFRSLHHGTRALDAVEHAVEFTFAQEDRHIHVRGCPWHAPRAQRQRAADGIGQTILVKPVGEPPQYVGRRCSGRDHFASPDNFIRSRIATVLAGSDSGVSARARTSSGQSERNQGTRAHSRQVSARRSSGVASRHGAASRRRWSSPDRTRTCSARRRFSACKFVSGVPDMTVFYSYVGIGEEGVALGAAW